MSSYQYLVRVPICSVDETTMGEWLEEHNVEYRTSHQPSNLRSSYEFHFSSKSIADQFARMFVG